MGGARDESGSTSEDGGWAPVGVAIVQGGGLTNDDDNDGTMVEGCVSKERREDFALSEGGSVPLLVVEICDTALCGAAPRTLAWEGDAME